MTRYRSARILASILAVAGWLLTVPCLLILILSLVRVLPPILAFVSWLPLLVGAVLGLVVVLVSHIARAVFDIADAASVRSPAMADDPSRPTPLRHPA